MSETPYPGTDRYTMAELMAVSIARALKGEDGRVPAVGMDSEIPFAGIRMARLTVAPNLWYWEDRLEHFQTMYEVVGLGMIGPRKWGLGFNGGIQVDKYGNLNMIGIGPYDNLQVRGPGGIGLVWMSTMRKNFQYFYHHSKRVFVEKVDYISGPGFLTGGDSRWKVCPKESLGPQMVFTPIAVMDFEEGSHRMRLKSVNPGYEVKDVVANTGFDLVIPSNVPQTRAPSDNELLILRTMVDRDGILRRFSRLTVG